MQSLVPFFIICYLSGLAGVACMLFYLVNVKKHGLYIRPRVNDPLPRIFFMGVAMIAMCIVSGFIVVHGMAGAGML